MEKMIAETLYPSQCSLGEGPIWHAERNCCYWVDIEKGILFEYDWKSKQTRHWNFDHYVTLVLPAGKNHVFLALDTSIARFDLLEEKIEWLFKVEDDEANRCNDGAVDASGRLWVGTMHKQHQQGAGALYSIDSDRNISRKISNTTISNGIVWSLDGKRMYYIDSGAQFVQSYLFDEATGEISFEKNVIEVPKELGTPDGMTIDEEGMLWVAHWGGFGVYRWNPDTGELLQKIELPVPQVTSCAFAGDNLDYLIISSSRENFTEKDQQDYPESGNLFCIKMHVKGVEMPGCKL
jgi:sugar lactone lactonase YvrE